MSKAGSFVVGVAASWGAYYYTSTTAHEGRNKCIKVMGGEAFSPAHKYFKEEVDCARAGLKNFIPSSFSSSFTPAVSSKAPGGQAPQKLQTGSQHVGDAGRDLRGASGSGGGASASGTDDDDAQHWFMATTTDKWNSAVLKLRDGLAKPAPLVDSVVRKAEDVWVRFGGRPFN